MHQQYKWGGEFTIIEPTRRSGDEYVVLLESNDFKLSPLSKRLHTSQSFQTNTGRRNIQLLAKTPGCYGFRGTVLMAELFHRMEKERGVRLCPHYIAPEILLRKVTGNINGRVIIATEPIYIGTRRYLFSIEENSSHKLYLNATQANYDTPFGMHDVFILLLES